MTRSIQIPYMQPNSTKYTSQGWDRPTCFTETFHLYLVKLPKSRTWMISHKLLQYGSKWKASYWPASIKLSETYPLLKKPSLCSRVDFHHSAISIKLLFNKSWSIPLDLRVYCDRISFAEFLSFSHFLTTFASSRGNEHQPLAQVTHVLYVFTYLNIWLSSFHSLLSSVPVRIKVGKYNCILFANILLRSYLSVSWSCCSRSACNFLSISHIINCF